MMATSRIDSRIRNLDMRRNIVSYSPDDLIMINWMHGNEVLFLKMDIRPLLWMYASKVRRERVPGYEWSCERVGSGRSERHASNWGYLLCASCEFGLDR